MFTALEAARREAQEVRGGMIWRELNGKTRLIRVSAAGAHTSLGELGDETQRLYDRFKARKEPLEARVVALKKQMEMHERLNRALRLGRVPNIVVATLKALQERDLLEQFTVVGTHALYAYEMACGVRIRMDQENGLTRITCGRRRRMRASSCAPRNSSVALRAPSQ